jgi:hypothetical protein
MFMLKKSAADYMHPELPAVVTDLIATAYSYFDRHSVPEVDSVKEAEYFAQVVVDMILLKALVTDYMHPEILQVLP